LRFVDGCAFFAGYKQTGECVVAWQAADMGGENAVAADDHGKTTSLLRGFG
jgi:hypothetical protein